MQERRSFQYPSKAVALVLAGGRGSRLFELTDRRAKPAVYFGGKYRIVDFVLSSLINSGIHSIYVVVQFRPVAAAAHQRRLSVFPYCWYVFLQNSVVSNKLLAWMPYINLIFCNLNQLT